VDPASTDALPQQSIPFTATLAPGVTPPPAVTWTLTDPTGSASIKADATDSTKAVFQAPAPDKVGDPPPVITVKACVKVGSDDICGTARVTVPRIQFYIAGSKSALAPDETVQLTAFYQGTNLPRKVMWPAPFSGSLSPAIPGETLADTLVVLYKAPPLPEGE